MTLTEFLTKHCTACGGNWAAMIMSGIRSAFPERYAQMEDREYDWKELCQITVECGVIWDE